MFPMEFDHKALDTLPFPDGEGIKRVTLILKAIINRRVMSYFKSKRGTDPVDIVKAGEHLKTIRLEDELNFIRVVSMISRSDSEWTIHIHERVFDYFVFVIPSDPESRLGERTPEERKMLAYAEFLLRHEFEHVLYPQKSESEVIHSDIVFAMDRRNDDPTFYRTLRSALDDEMSGLRGKPYLALLDAAEQERGYESHISRILRTQVIMLGDIPEEMLKKIFPVLDPDIKTRVLGECARRSRSTVFSLSRRSSFIQKTLRLFKFAIETNEKEAETVFNSFKDHWGLVVLFHELDLPESSVEDVDPGELFTLFKEKLEKLTQEGERPLTPSPTPTPPRLIPMELETGQTAVKSLKDRIEEARNNPAFPRYVIDVIDKNKLNAVGHSGAKYSELIETLLAIPWGKIQKISVTPQGFEEGLNRTHYGLRRPKEIVCDLFTNLIWRYKNFAEEGAAYWHKTGSAFLFVGPPGVGKTSLAISIAKNLGIPYHKISLGGMRDEADIRGHGFTYEGSKPGAIVQGLIKTGIMNGMFIMDEADKTEKFAIATLLEILDPEQNHLYHDKYTETTVDIDLSNCHFVLTANTLETVPPTVINRCEVILLDRYSIEEKVAIAEQYLIARIRENHQISEEEIYFDRAQQTELLRMLIKEYTYEPGVRELERIIRTLFLRIFRKDVLLKGQHPVRITRAKIKEHLDLPRRPWQINDTSRVGEMLGLGVDVARGVGSVIPIQATRIRPLEDRDRRRQGFMSMVHATGNIEKVMDESRKVATTGILYCADRLHLDLKQADAPIHLHFMGASSRKDGPSAGGAIALALASVLSGRAVRRDVAMTGEIDTQGRVTAVGAVDVKLETAIDAGCKTMIIPKDNLLGDEGIERLPDALKKELQVLTYQEWKGVHDPFDYHRHVLQVVAVDHIVDAADIAFIDQNVIDSLDGPFVAHARSVAETSIKSCFAPGSCFRLLYAKDPSEIYLEHLNDVFWEMCQCVFLFLPEVKEAFLNQFPGLQRFGRFWDFDPAIDRLSSVIHEIKRNQVQADSATSCISIVAPFFFLKRDGVNALQLSEDLSLEVRLFANNYTIQEVKIKGCKPFLNRVYSHLSNLTLAQLDACPFLARKDGVYVTDISFIPEKYRLDLQQAERIFNDCLKKWLAIVESQNECVGP
ncbi:MAG: AAA family ATPase [Deltaproteobacteria bacterium]|nr:AAA family ATPase [Deltaproteobacteria bacterium]